MHEKNHNSTIVLTEKQMTFNSTKRTQITTRDKIKAKSLCKSYPRKKKEFENILFRDQLFYRIRKEEYGKKHVMTRETINLSNKNQKCSIFAILRLKMENPYKKISINSS